MRSSSREEPGTKHRSVSPEPPLFRKVGMVPSHTMARWRIPSLLGLIVLLSCGSDQPLALDTTESPPAEVEAVPSTPAGEVPEVAVDVWPMLTTLLSDPFIVELPALLSDGGSRQGLVEAKAALRAAVQNRDASALWASLARVESELAAYRTSHAQVFDDELLLDAMANIHGLARGWIVLGGLAAQPTPDVPAGASAAAPGSPDAAVGAASAPVPMTSAHEE